MDFSYINSEDLISSATLLGAYCVLFLLARWIHNFLTSYNVSKELTESDNVAVAISVAGFYIAVTIIFIGAAEGPGVGLAEDLIAVFGYSLAGIFLLLISRWLNDKLILFKFSTTKEIVTDKNPGTGVVQAASYIASALVVAGSIHGEGGGPISTVVFFLIGQAILVLFGLFYEKITPYSIHEEIEKDNFAAGLGFAGGLISIGVIIMKATSGDFEGWSVHLGTLVFDVVLIFVLLFFVRLFFDKVVIAQADLKKEISEDRNVGAGLLEMIMSITFAVVLFYLL